VRDFVYLLFELRFDPLTGRLIETGGNVQQVPLKGREFEH
jgi:hypothetical protein